MKKLISILLASIMMLTLFTFFGCEKNDEADAEALKLGLGTYTTVKASDATEDKQGQGQATITAAAVLVDNDGKIVKAFIDCADNKVNYTDKGEAIANTSFTTKYEAGKSYGMTNPAYGGTSTKEWYEQADAFCALIVGKTADEINALVAEGGKGTDDVINAGCTIAITEFVKAVDNASKNATASNATKNDTLKLGVSTAQTTANATEDKNGSNKTETVFFAAAVNSEGKVVAASSDSVEVSFTFDDTGKSTFDATKAVLSKKEQGDSYGMKSPYGSTKEWYEHAAAFDATCIGKTVAEIEGLLGSDGKGNADVQSAGCTILVSVFVKAASKIK